MNVAHYTTVTVNPFIFLLQYQQLLKFLACDNPILLLFHYDKIIIIF